MRLRLEPEREIEFLKTHRELITMAAMLGDIAAGMILDLLILAQIYPCEESLTNLILGLTEFRRCLLN